MNFAGNNFVVLNLDILPLLEIFTVHILQIAAVIVAFKLIALITEDVIGKFICELHYLKIKILINWPSIILCTASSQYKTEINYTFIMQRLGILTTHKS